MKSAAPPAPAVLFLPHPPHTLIQCRGGTIAIAEAIITIPIPPEVGMGTTRKAVSAVFEFLNRAEGSSRRKSMRGSYGNGWFWLPSAGSDYHRFRMWIP